MSNIDLNCDMGESFGPWKMGHDAEVMAHITSANVACGAHAGDPNVMVATVALAKRHGVAVGAHPGFFDLQGFGRRGLSLTAGELRSLVLYQLGALWAFVHASGQDLHHVKPHGALYNMACASGEIATPVVSAIREFSNSLAVYCLPDSELEHEIVDQGLIAVPEGFADRAYEPDGSLVDRRKPGSVSSEPDIAVERALRLAQGSVLCADGTTLKLTVRTICVHGDTPGAPAIAAAVRSALSSAGYSVTAALNG